MQRWIRVRRGNDVDAKNMMRARREGWTPRDQATGPEGWAPPTDAHGMSGNIIQVEGMVLMELPIRRNEQRRKYYERRTAAQTAAVDQDLLKAQVPGLPIHKSHSSRVSVGRRIAAQPDSHGDDA